MVLFVGYHFSSPRNRRSILAHGLVSHQPKNGTPAGVYVFHPDLRNPHILDNCPTVLWGDWTVPVLLALTGEGNVDLWRVVYCGRMQRDIGVDNAAILPSVSDVTLVTGNE